LHPPPFNPPVHTQHGGGVPWGVVTAAVVGGTSEVWVSG
jgi:hypothetical protein